MIYLSLGSNLGDREKFLQQARELLEKSGAVHITKKSKLYETEPVGKKDQPMFLNQCVEIETELSPQQLLQLCQKIENELGRPHGRRRHSLLLARERKEKWGPRTIDIDILFYKAQIIDEPDLKIPHPLMHERRFVLVPLTEIAPDFIHPILKSPLIKILQQLEDKSIVVPKE